MNAANRAVTASPRTGLRSIRPVTKSHAATETTAPTSPVSSPQNQRARREGRRAASRAASCMASPRGGAPGRSISGTGGASATDGVGFLSSRSIRTGPLVIAHSFAT